ncbi:MAG: ATP-binding domain-containing protein [Lachnospiraceae bacterium]|nr:ATP-binding domain-containing protein [Lachnospiraceae bacterium]
MQADREEQRFLEGLKGKMAQAAERLRERMGNYSNEYRDYARYIWEHQNVFDKYEAMLNRGDIEQLAGSGDVAAEKYRRILSMMDSPFFARIDFEIETLPDEELEEPERMQAYIGRAAFRDGLYEVFDWRAPISGIYYEYEYGPASYEAPAGRVEGRLLGKRQYRIEKGEFVYVLESSLRIHDDILVRELSRTSDPKMRDIAMTIQKEQNRLIRNASAKVMILQGAAGSGKTSVALHRAAWLMYRFRGELSAEDFLIVTPNAAFDEYISNVLPELGEKPVRCTGMEEIAAGILGTDMDFESPGSQAETYLYTDDKAWMEREAYKSSMEFLREADRYLAWCDENLFSVEEEGAQDHEAMDPELWEGGRLSLSGGTSGYAFRGGFIELEWIMKRLCLRRAMPVRERLDEIAGEMEEEIRIRYRSGAEGTKKGEIFDCLWSRLRHRSALSLYQGFYEYIGRPGLFVRGADGRLEGGDVFPLIYMKLYLEGIPKRGEAKHLLVDEMQDYTPVQYAVLNRLYPCSKTIVGDAAQNVAPFVREPLAFLRELYPGAAVEEIRKSYRSTWEIMEFARRVGREIQVEPVSRHGAEPEVVRCHDIGEEQRFILERLRQQKACGRGGTMAVLCKSAVQAGAWQEWLSGLGEDSVAVMSVAMSKGLEFDQVVIPEADDANYHTEYERGLLYVACTRAMHRLTLLYSGEASRFIPDSV